MLFFIVKRACGKMHKACRVQHCLTLLGEKYSACEKQRLSSNMVLIENPGFNLYTTNNKSSNKTRQNELLWHVAETRRSALTIPFWEAALRSRAPSWFASSVGFCHQFAFEAKIGRGGVRLLGCAVASRSPPLATPAGPCPVPVGAANQSELFSAMIAKTTPSSFYKMT